MNKIENHKKKVLDKLDKMGEKTQMWVIKKSLKGMNQNQLEGVISICLANNKPDEQKEKQEILDTIKDIYKQKNYKWIYD